MVLICVFNGRPFIGKKSITVPLEKTANEMHKLLEQYHAKKEKSLEEKSLTFTLDLNLSILSKTATAGLAG